ncbi:acyl-CoA dehydrogenase family protein [Actinokineospora enzanensis]|uniref:acyl-CoA dehydrogenase family protein n=1 Tax=Actinokineospora enzanensis TaxID=155975 RepID=UPI0003728CED|nr:acyl-CoA dehydrogenase family protein [Actinokineospora enzanensis]
MSESGRVGLWQRTPDAEEQDWLGRVAALAPVLRAGRDQAEHDRATPAEVFAELRDAGIPRMWVSTEFGGEQVSLRTGSAVIRALARLDASIAWQMGVQGAIGRLSDYLPEQTARELFKNHAGLVVGGVNPSGRAEAVQGGYRLSGEWGFASGSAHADWLVCAAPVTLDGKPVTGAAGPQLRMLFIPKADAEMLDTWYTVGLRGTGSNHYRVRDVFVPEEYTVDRADMLAAPADRLSRAYPIGYYDFGPFTSASTALGIAQDALDTFTELALTKTPTLGLSKLASGHTTQEKLARAEMLAHTAELLLRDAADQAVAHGEDGGDRLSALVRVVAATVAEHASTAVDIAYTLAGSSSLYATSRLERCFRDVHSAVKHITLSPSHFEMVGQYLLGGGLHLRR